MDEESGVASDLLLEESWEDSKGVSCSLAFCWAEVK